jgi:hypothetical protein
MQCFMVCGVMQCYMVCGVMQSYMGPCFQSLLQGAARGDIWRSVFLSFYCYIIMFLGLSEIPDGVVLCIDV